MIRFPAVVLLAAIVLLGAVGCGENDPASQIDTINELMEKDFPLTEQQRSEVERLVAEGSELASTGSPEQAGAVLDGAIELLRFAEDAAMFNKSE
ncbi:MAG: hypothetical protein U5R46_14695 [Gammaproteobacteria bacterium]|nr:hypothetical protein [Gammaproteobacteria bacterium]